VADANSDLIDSEIATPAASSADGQSATARPIADTITGINAREMRDAIKKRRRGISFTRLTTPGAADDQGGTLSGSTTPGQW